MIPRKIKPIWKIYTLTLELYIIIAKKIIFRKNVFFTNSYVISDTPFASIYKQVNTCSNNFASSLITLEKNISLATINAHKEKWCLNKFFKVGNDNIFIVATTFNLRQIAK